MKKGILLFVILVNLGCENFQLNPLSPSVITRGSGGPELRIHPNLGSIDYQKMFTNPEEWSEARSKITVFQFHHGNVEEGSGCPICGTIDGRFNRFDDLAKVDAFSKLTQWGIPISVEMGALKPHNCENPERDMQLALSAAINSINRIKSAGGRVIDISIDEPFMGGMLRFDWSGRGIIEGCEHTAERAAQLTRDYWIKPLQAAHPDVQVGLTEAYPTFNTDELIRNISELERDGYRLPFLHVDYHRYGVIMEGQDFTSDMRKLQNFLRSRNIKFGIIVWGESGNSSEEWYADAYAMATQWRNALGNSPDRIILESWSMYTKTALSGSYHYYPRYYPDNLPETRSGTMTYMINQMSLFFR